MTAGYQWRKLVRPERMIVDSVLQKLVQIRKVALIQFE